MSWKDKVTLKYKMDVGINVFTITGEPTVDPRYDETLVVQTDQGELRQGVNGPVASALRTYEFRHKTCIGARLTVNRVGQGKNDTRYTVLNVESPPKQSELDSKPF